MAHHIGITGTRDGMNKKQAREVRELLQRFFDAHGPEMVFHHGDCVGVDVEAAKIAREIGYFIVGHIPIKTELRGYFPSDETRAPKNYLSRNRDIVDESSEVLVVPAKDHKYARSGTWYTHDYAFKHSTPRHVVWPTRKD